MALLTRRSTRATRRADGTDRRWTKLDDLPSRLTNAVRFLINSRELAHEAPLPGRIAVTSAIPGEGVTTISQTLACVLADDFGASVCWVDLAWTDRRRPALRDTNRQRAGIGPGLAGYLTGEIDFDDAIEPTGHTRISVVRYGTPLEGAKALIPRPGELADFFDALSQEFDHVVIDMPPVLGPSTSLPLFRYAEAYLLVVRAGVTRNDQIRTASGQLGDLALIGTVLNQQAGKAPRLLRRLRAD